MKFVFRKYNEFRLLCKEIQLSISTLYLDLLNPTPSLMVKKVLRYFKEYFLHPKFHENIT